MSRAKDPVPPYSNRFSIRHSRHKLWVCVWNNRRDMLRAAKAQGCALGPATRACTIHEPGRTTIHFTKRCLGAEVVAHECCHAAQRILQCKRVRKFRNENENLPFWTGQITGAANDWLYSEGILTWRK
jgi:hypothetical protein